jgi:membrane peptidoglycan carboxypeptidase
MKVIKLFDKKNKKTKAISKYKSQTLANKNKNKDLIVKIVKNTVLVFAVVVLLGAIALTVLIIKYAFELPPPGTPFNKVYAQTTQIYSRGGTLLYSFHGSQNREWIPISQIPKKVQWAVIAAEDKNFYNEPLGISFRGILRALYYDLFKRSSGSLEGGSTITQQLVKDTVLTPQQTIQRKLKEIILTIEISQKYSKKDVLEQYLNEVYFGGNVYGIKVASETYFGKEPNQLTLAQSAILAGMIQAPSFYSPLFGTNPKYLVPRADYVLNQMLADKYETGVTKSEIEQAKNQVAHMQYNSYNPSQNIKDPWFVYYVKNQLEQKYGVSTVDNSGWKVYTTLSWKIQQIAQQTVVNAVNYLVSNGFNAHNAALVSVDPNNGEILSMVGAYKYGVSLYNGQMDGYYNAALAPRQPGSSIKPFLYATAFQDLGFSPTTLVTDLPIDINGYKPLDWNDLFEGPQSIKVALRQSRNIPAVETLYSLGTTKFINELHLFGFTGISQYKNDLSIAIGSAGVPLLQNTEAYSVLANGGIKYPTVSILKIVNPEGKIVYQYNPQKYGQRIIKQRYVYLVDTIIDKFPTLYYSPSPIYNGYSGGITAKTGTSNLARDLVLMGYTPSLATGMWAGNDNNAPTTNYSYGEDLTPFWNKYMLTVLPMFPKEKFNQPPGIVSAYVCSNSGLLAGPTTPCSKTLGLFAEGQLPKPDNSNIEVKVCKEDPNLLATQSQIAAGDYENKVYVQLHASAPIFQAALDSWESSQGGVYSPPPTQYCNQYTGPNNTIQVNVSSPTANQTYVAGTSGNISVSGVAISPNNITNITISLEDSSGNVIGNDTQTISGNPNFNNVNFPIPSQPGNYIISVNAKDSNNVQGSATVNISVTNSSSNTSSNNGTNG